MSRQVRWPPELHARLVELIRAVMLHGRDTRTDPHGFRLTIGLLVHQWYTRILPRYRKLGWSTEDLLTALEWYRTPYDAPQEACSFMLWIKDPLTVEAALSHARKSQPMTAKGGGLIQMALEGVDEIPTAKDLEAAARQDAARREFLREARARGVDLADALRAAMGEDVAEPKPQRVAPDTSADERRKLLKAQLRRLQG